MILIKSRSKGFLPFFCLIIFSFLTNSFLISADNKLSQEERIKRIQEKYNDNYVKQLQEKYEKKYDQEYIKSVQEKYDSDYVFKILFSKEIREEKLFNLYNKEIFSFPIWEFDNPQNNHKYDQYEKYNQNLKEEDLRIVKAGLYVGDIFKGAFWTLDLLLDRFLYKNSKECSTNIFVDKFDNNLDNLNNLLEEIKQDEETFDQDEKILTNSGKQKITDFIQKNCNLPYLTLLKSNAFKQIASYCILFELLRFTKNKFLLDPSYNTIKYAIKKSFFNKENGQKYLKEVSQQIFKNILPSYITIPSTFWAASNGAKPDPIPMFDFFQLFTWSSRSLTTNLSSGFHWLNDLCKFIAKAHLTSTEKGKDKKWMIAYTDFYSVLILKELIILTSSVKYLHTNLYQKTLIDHILNNFDDFCDLIKEYKSTKNLFKNGKIKSEEFNTIKEKIRSFILASYEFSFKTWVKNKNGAFFWREFTANLIFNLPVYIITGKAIYIKCKELHVLEKTEKIINFVKNNIQINK
ncbi:hypothetical protein K9M16_03375 [Candidatus Babeliales bacterium]|nr:hypothetical protein [Candidatus Babeliales bacterium]